MVLWKKVWTKSCFFYWDRQNKPLYVKVGRLIKKFLFCWSFLRARNDEKRLKKGLVSNKYLSELFSMLLNGFLVHENPKCRANFRLLVAYWYKKTAKIGIFAVFPNFRETLFSLTFSFIIPCPMKIMQKFKKNIDPHMFLDHLHYF